MPTSYLEKGLVFFNLNLVFLLGLNFFIFQLFEYFNNYYDMLDSFLNNIFYFLTGLHMIHVLLGLLLWFLLFYFLSRKIFSEIGHFFLFIKTIFLYWSFVDFIWLIIYLILYIGIFYLNTINLEYIIWFFFILKFSG